MACLLSHPSIRVGAASTAKRIVSVCPSNTDPCAHLGILDQVVGRDTWSDWPEGRVDGIEVIGPVLNINTRRVIELEPDLILASLNVPGMERVVPRLKATGLPMVIYDPETWDDVITNLIDLGERMDLSDRAKAVVASAEEEVERLQEESAQLPWVDLCVEWWPDPVIVPKKETYVNQVLSWVKVRSPFREEEGRSGPVTLEYVIEKNPDLYSVSWCGTPWEEFDEQSVVDRYAGSGAKFVQDPNKIFKLWEGEIGHPSMRLLDGARRVLEQRKRLGI